MAIHYVNTGTPLGALPRIQSDVNLEFEKSPTAIFKHLLFNLRGMERVFDGKTMAAEKYPRTYAEVPDQYVTNGFTQESAEKKRTPESPAVNSVLLRAVMPTNPANSLELNSRGKKEAGLKNDYVAYLQLYRIYQQVLRSYNGIAGNARSHANQVYNSTVEAFKKLRQGIYRSGIKEGVQKAYSPNLRAKFSGNARRVLEYLRNDGTGYLRAIKRQHLPAHDISVKGLEALLQEA